jgi:hypothetical protein
MRYNKALTGMLRASQGRLTNRLRKIPRIQASVFDL